MDILYIHPAKQEVEARYDKFRSCPPYPFIPVGVVGFVNMLRAEGYNVRGLNLPLNCCSALPSACASGFAASASSPNSF